MTFQPPHSLGTELRARRILAEPGDAERFAAAVRVVERNRLWRVAMFRCLERLSRGLSQGGGVKEW